MTLPDATRIFVCYDYKAPGREEFAWETTIDAEKMSNVHIGGGVSRAEFVALREGRDATLGMPKLIIPSLQVNIRAGNMPEPDKEGPDKDGPDKDGRVFLKTPIDGL